MPRRKKVVTEPGTRHGSYFTYLVLECRCERCVARGVWMRERTRDGRDGFDIGQLEGAGAPVTTGLAYNPASYE